MNSRRHLLVLGSVAVAAFSLAACGASGSGSLVEKTSPSVTASASASAAPSASATAGGSSGGAATGTIGGTGSGTGTGTGTGSGSGPTLAINVTTQASCASGTNLHMVPGVSPVIAWHSTGTTNVTLNLDGGLFGTFPSDGSDEIPFTCSGTTDGQTVSHTYTFTTVPGGVTRSVTLTSTYHIITNVGSGPTTAPPATPSAPPSS